MAHPYVEFEHTELWKKVNKIIESLIENQDIEATTKKEYVVGYICKNLLELTDHASNQIK